ncbi:hypothetical protein U9M48_028242 [Paspalum notatum var. saurae]|uniref:Uncharacterized protein n=1 Tax=Paspalum notatum var. saurae TaxID=547442 RepID=A0AAQ3TW39_PASNO
MSIAPYTLRLSPPPRLDAPLFRPHLRRRGPPKVAVTSTSWASAGDDSDSDDGVGGWWLPDHAKPVEQRRKTGFGRAVAVSLGASAAIALAGLSWQSPSSRKCLQQLIVAPLHYVQEKLSTLKPTETPNEDASYREPAEDEVFRTTPDVKAESIIDDSIQNHREGVHNHFSFRAPIDPVHEEAFSILKKLQIIEENVRPSDFCTRREFARWFVKLCSRFERKRMQKIVPDKLTSASLQSAFDDVNINDPDFLYIQFQMLNENVRILDWRAWPDVPPSMVLELMAGENSIISRVFGNTRRLQPHKPVTKAQAAAALTSGRMEEAIRDELNRLETENQAHLSAIAEIMEELISRGDIQQQWEEKIKKEQQRALEVDNGLQHVLHELAHERTDREKELEDLLKESAALERQNQELINLRSEVDGMYDRLAAENAEAMVDQQNLENLLSDMTSKHQAVNEAKSYLEAEKEALTMLRTWVEEEAARVHERAETLKNAPIHQKKPSEELEPLSAFSFPETGEAHPGLRLAKL